MDEAQLVAQLRCRTPAAMEELVHSCGDRLLRSAFLLCGDETEAQDLVQETFVQAWQSAHRFRGTSSVFTWLNAILLHLARHYCRRRKRLVDCPALSEMPAPRDDSNSVDSGDAAGALAAALNRLPEGHREVVVLRFYEDLKIHEIAARLALSPGTVKSRLHYAMSKLKNLLPAEMNLFGDGGTKESERR